MLNYIEIDSTPSKVFEYIAKLEKHREWQEAILKSTKTPPGMTHLGTRNTELRQIPGGVREFTSEIIEYEPPAKIAARTVSKAPIQSAITITIKSINGGTKSGVTFDLKLSGTGKGKLIVLFARINSKKQIPKDLIQLKSRLENVGNSND